MLRTPKPCISGNSFCISRERLSFNKEGITLNKSPLLHSHTYKNSGRKYIFIDECLAGKNNHRIFASTDSTTLPALHSVPGWNFYFIIGIGISGQIQKWKSIPVKHEYSALVLHEYFASIMKSTSETNKRQLTPHHFL